MMTIIKRRGGYQKDFANRSNKCSYGWEHRGRELSVFLRSQENRSGYSLIIVHSGSQ
jgi:hypothetical protein